MFDNEERRPIIGTHDGNFHADEILACHILLQLPEYKDAQIIRSRNPAVLDGCDVVVDVGHIYDHSRFRYDHHQRGFSEDSLCVASLGGGGAPVKLSSAGLVYKHHGMRVVKSRYHETMMTSNRHREGTEEDEEADVEDAYFAMYDNFVKAVDAIDNGISMFDAGKDGARALYKQSTSLSARVARMNSAWNEPYSVDSQYARFQSALRLVGEEFEQMLRHDVLSVWLPGKKAVREALSETNSNIIEMVRPCPWRDHLHTLERPPGSVLYVLYPESYDNNNERWRVQAVNIGPGSFTCRKPFPEGWRGLAGAELSSACGVPGSVFVHAGGFIGGNETREGALRMAQASLAETRSDGER